MPKPLKLFAVLLACLAHASEPSLLYFAMNILSPPVSEEGSWVSFGSPEPKVAVPWIIPCHVAISRAVDRYAHSLD